MLISKSCFQIKSDSWKFPLIAYQTHEYEGVMYIICQNYFHVPTCIYYSPHIHSYLLHTYTMMLQLCRFQFPYSACHNILRRMSIGNFKQMHVTESSISPKNTIFIVYSYFPITFLIIY